MPTSVYAAFAFGQKINYAASWPTVEFRTDYTLAIGVHDQRPYVVSGEKKPTYVGVVRARYGNPWNVNTQSDKPLSEDIASAIVSGFKRADIQATSIPILFSDDSNFAIKKLQQLGAKRIALVTLREWRGDSYKSFGFFINAVIRVYDETGKELASSSVSHLNVGSGDGSVMSVDYAARLYLGMLLNEEKIRASLGGSQSALDVKEISRDDRFVAYNNGTVIDTKNNLMWANRDNGLNINWKSAHNYCASYNRGGHKDWRMPTHDELAGLYDNSKSRHSACDSNQPIGFATALINLSCYYLWASDLTPRTFRDPNAASIYFGNGKLYWYDQTTEYFYFRILPVRSAEIIRTDHVKINEAEIKKNSSNPSQDIQTLRELKKLRDDGFLTEKEYEQKRKTIVDGI